MNGINYKRAASMLTFIDFPNRTQYSSRNYAVITPRSTMNSSQLVYLDVEIILPHLLFLLLIIFICGTIVVP